MAATGFTQRWMGKVLAKVLGLGTGGITLYSLPGNPTISPADLLTIDGTGGAATAYSTAGTQTLAASVGAASINASSGASVFALGAVPVPGGELTLSLTVSSAVFIKAAAGSAFDASTNTVFKSTFSQQVVLYGLSTARWAFKSVYTGSTAGGAPVGGLTLSTTT